MSATDKDILMVELEVARRMEAYHSEIERRILDGERDFEVKAPLSGEPVRFQVPGWWRHPVKRAQFERVLRRQRSALSGDEGGSEGGESGE